MAGRGRYDVVIVGYGIAGVTAAIEAADAGASVLALDRGYGGGASALSGGIVYAGGGTRHQKAAGLSDTADNMFNYLRQEVRGAVSDTTLRRFCETSPSTIDWLEEQGAMFGDTLCPYKTSYPSDEHYLYYSGNEKAWPYNLHAEPAARGHRQIAKGMRSGRVLFEALRESARKKGVVFQPLSRVESLITEDGLVNGVRYRSVDLGASIVRKHRRLSGWAAKLANWIPPVGAKLTAKAERLWRENATAVEIRAGAVILAAGGFVFNPEMKAEYEGGFADISPVGTAGDDGSGIKLGLSAGGSTAMLDRMTAWRFMSPPSALLEGISVGPSGIRIANEDLYGATHTQIMVDEHHSRGFLIIDERQWKKARSQIKAQCQPFQFAQAAYLFSVGHKKAATLDGLAKKIGINSDNLAKTVRAYNDGIASTEGDPAHKGAELCSPIISSPFYAINTSIKNSFAYPAPGLTLGGLRVDEETGLVLAQDGTPIPGLYAAGRTAVGICSNNYMSGTALADGIFSGRRAGVHAAVHGGRSVPTG